jgi:hypothetical protein
MAPRKYRRRNPAAPTGAAVSHLLGLPPQLIPAALHTIETVMPGRYDLEAALKFGDEVAAALWQITTRGSSTNGGSFVSDQAAHYTLKKNPDGSYG